MQALVLASGSQYRAQLLARLNMPITSLSPDIDESAQAAEQPMDLARRLADQKARKALEIITMTTDETHSGSDDSTSIIIASDQVAANGDTLLGKPGSVERACAQLASMSGGEVVFFTALCMHDTGTDKTYSAVDVTRVRLRELDAPTIARYVAADAPLDCAGSFKVESLGISLFKAVHTDDPTALIGLPMIKVCEGLRHFGLAVP